MASYHRHQGPPQGYIIIEEKRRRRRRERPSRRTQGDVFFETKRPSKRVQQDLFVEIERPSRTSQQDVFFDIYHKNGSDGYIPEENWGYVEEEIGPVEYLVSPTSHHNNKRRRKNKKTVEEFYIVEDAYPRSKRSHRPRQHHHRSHWEHVYMLEDGNGLDDKTYQYDHGGRHVSQLMGAQDMVVHRSGGSHNQHISQSAGAQNMVAYRSGGSGNQHISQSAGAQEMVVYRSGGKQTGSYQQHQRNQATTVSERVVIEENDDDDDDLEERVISVISQPPIPQTKHRSWIGGENMQASSTKTMEVIEERPISVNQTRQQKETFTSSNTNNGGKTTSYSRTQTQNGGNMVRSSTRNYEKSVMSTKKNGEVNTDGAISSTSDMQRQPTATKMRSTKTALANNDGEEIYDRITFENTNQLQSAPPSNQLQLPTHLSDNGSAANNKMSRQSSKRSVTITTKEVSSNSMEGGSIGRKISSSSLQSPSRKQSSLKVGHDWQTWMEEQRQSNQNHSLDPISIAPTSIYGEGYDGGYGVADQGIPTGRPRTDTELVQPEETEHTGNHHNYDDRFEEMDAVDAMDDQMRTSGRPGGLGGDSGGPDVGSIGAGDGSSGNDAAATTGGKPGKVSFLDSIKKTFSPKKSAKKNDNDEKSFENLKDKVRDQVKDVVNCIGDAIDDYLEEHPSPWGRIKKCGNPETCKELKDRILGRTIFMTPTYANAEHNKHTELNIDRMPTDENKTYFVSRSVEYDSDSDDDATDPNNAAKKSKKEDCGKCGIYTKFYCKECERWQTDCCGHEKAENS